MINATFPERKAGPAPAGRCPGRVLRLGKSTRPHAPIAGACSAGTINLRGTGSPRSVAGVSAALRVLSIIVSVRDQSPSAATRRPLPPRSPLWPNKNRRAPGSRSATPRHGRARAAPHAIQVGFPSTGRTLHVGEQQRHHPLGSGRSISGHPRRIPQRIRSNLVHRRTRPDHPCSHLVIAARRPLARSPARCGPR
jgi:hypothetical protein